MQRLTLVLDAHNPLERDQNPCSPMIGVSCMGKLFVWLPIILFEVVALGKSYHPSWKPLGVVHGLGLLITIFLYTAISIGSK